MKQRGGYCKTPVSDDAWWREMLWNEDGLSGGDQRGELYGRGDLGE